eukprot:2112460-Amphidinium_carterae.1
MRKTWRKNEFRAGGSQFKSPNLAQLSLCPCASLWGRLLHDGTRTKLSSPQGSSAMHMARPHCRANPTQRIDHI